MLTFDKGGANGAFIPERFEYSRRIQTFRRLGARGFGQGHFGPPQEFNEGWNKKTRSEVFLCITVTCSGDEYVG
jgi:hypothetical protein